MKNAIKKFIIASFGALTISSGLYAEESNHSLFKGAACASGSALCATLFTTSSRIAFFRALRGAPTAQLTPLASGIFFAGAHLLARGRDELRKVPPSKKKDMTLYGLLRGSVYLILPTLAQPIPLPQGTLSKFVKNLAKGSRLALMAYAGTTLFATTMQTMEA